MQVHSGSRLIKAPLHAIYRAHLDPSAVAAWRPPPGMSGRILLFEPRVGGVYRMVFAYEDGGRENAGKSTADADIFEGRFAELIPDTRIVEIIRFESEDAAFAGDMTLTTTLRATPEGAEVTVIASNVPKGIRAEDHEAGIAASLENLARFVE